MNSFAAAIADDHAGADEPYSGHDSLDHATRTGAVHPIDGEHDQCRAKPNETERPHARGPAVKIAIEPERDANQRRDDEPQSDIEGIHGDLR